MRLQERIQQMKLFQAWYKGKKFGKLQTEGQRAITERCFTNLVWEEIQ